MKTKLAMLVLGALLAGAPGSAQQDSTRSRMRAPRMARPGVERNIDAALARAEALGLDEARVEELRAMREELRAANRRIGEEARELARSAQARNRELREARRSEMRALAEQRESAVAPFRERFDDLLTEDERNRLRESMRRQRPARNAVARARAGGRAGDRVLRRDRAPGRAGVRAGRGFRPAQRFRNPAGRSDVLRRARIGVPRRPLPRRPRGGRMGVA